MNLMLATAVMVTLVEKVIAVDLLYQDQSHNVSSY